MAPEKVSVVSKIDGLMFKYVEGPVTSAEGASGERDPHCG
jgi:hypothetical protein